jgi:succinate dehydrogenase flavin-adding protein (antitoxin of CptAB toxin-antitoxin module)
MRELDVLLTRYVEEEYSDAAPELKAAFRRLLELKDPVIYDYFLGRKAAPDAVLAALIVRIAGGASGARS